MNSEVNLDRLEVPSPEATILVHNHHVFFKSSHSLSLPHPTSLPSDPELASSFDRRRGCVPVSPSLPSFSSYSGSWQML